MKILKELGNLITTLPEKKYKVLITITVSIYGMNKKIILSINLVIWFWYTVSGK